MPHADWPVACYGEISWRTLAPFLIRRMASELLCFTCARLHDATSIRVVDAEFALHRCAEISAWHNPSTACMNKINQAPIKYTGYTQVSACKRRT